MKQKQKPSVVVDSVEVLHGDHWHEIQPGRIYIRCWDASRPVIRVSCIGHRECQSHEPMPIIIRGRVV
jgi:hypothetical protein